MSLTAAAIRLMASKGMSAEDIADIAEAMSSPAEAISKGAMRTRRWREKNAKAVTSDVTVTHHGDVSPSCTQVVDPSLPSLRSEELKTPTHPSDASPRKAKSARSRLVPADWAPPPKLMTDLAGQGFMPGEIERELANFRDHEFRDPKTAWDLAFRKWMRNSRNFQPRKAPHERPHHDAKLAAKQANYARAWEGSERAARFRGEP